MAKKKRGYTMSQAALEARRKGGRALVQRYGVEYMRAMGQRGAEATHSRYNIVPVGLAQYSMVDKVTGRVVATF